MLEGMLFIRLMRLHRYFLMVLANGWLRLVFLSCALRETRFLQQTLRRSAICERRMVVR